MNYQELETKLSYEFAEPDLLIAAVTHPSFRYEDAQCTIDNQRLEFLGDAVINLVTAMELYRRYPDADEGFLTKKRSLLSSGKALAVVASKLGLGEYLRLGYGEKTSGGQKRPTNLADCLEAVIGAIYIDGGLSRAQDFISQHFGEYFAQLDVDDREQNPKGRLQEYTQKELKAMPEYLLIQENGLPHAKTYEVEVQINGVAYGHGAGSSKRAAEAIAAQEALHKLHLGRSAES